eukprot:364175-Chlamydomonas_euryale.AAC.2
MRGEASVPLSLVVGCLSARTRCGTGSAAKQQGSGGGGRLYNVNVGFLGKWGGGGKCAGLAAAESQWQGASEGGGEDKATVGGCFVWFLLWTLGLPFRVLGLGQNRVPDGDLLWFRGKVLFRLVERRRGTISKGKGFWGGGGGRPFGVKRLKNPEAERISLTGSCKNLFCGRHGTREMTASECECEWVWGKGRGPEEGQRRGGGRSRKMRRERVDKGG